MLSNPFTSIFNFKNFPCGFYQPTTPDPLKRGGMGGQEESGRREDEKKGGKRLKERRGKLRHCFWGMDAPARRAGKNRAVLYGKVKQ